MDWFTGAIVFLLTWWTVLFTVLPWGVRAAPRPPEEGIQAAPQNPMLKKKFIATTLISALVWLVIFVLIETDVISFRVMSQAMMAKDNTR